jgi:putative ABC transport system permease protein
MKSRRHKNTPPRLGQWLLKSFCSYDFLSTALWDLEEIYENNLKTKGKIKANLLYLKEVIGVVFHLYFKGKSIYSLNKTAMLKNNIITSLRSFKKNKAYTLLNILGLTSGLVVFILITLYVNHEFSYDQYHKNKDQIYRVNKTVPRGEELGNMELATVPVPLAPILKADFPEVQYAGRLSRSTNIFVKINDKSFLEPRIFYGESEIFNMFSFETIEGDISTFLTEKHTVVLSASAAIKYFGKTDVLGKVIYFKNEHPMQVVGVIKDIPSNSHFEMDVIFDFESILEINEYSPTSWRTRTYTYVMLDKQADPESFQANISELEGKYANNRMDDSRPVTYNLQALAQVHFGEEIRNEMKPTVSTQLLYIYMGIAFMILIIASINYVNLATGRAIKRTQEIGIRKVIGAQSRNLIFQFLTESFLLVFVSLLISLLCLLLILPPFAKFVGQELVLEFSDPILWLFLGGLCLGLSLLSGIYPALVLTSFKPITALKGKIQNTKGTLFKNILVIFQFTISAALILGTLVVSKQLNYIQTMDVGYVRDKVVILTVRDINVRKQLLVFNEELRNISGVAGVTLSNSNPGEFQRQGNVQFPGMEKRVQVLYEDVGYDYLDLYEIELIKGRNFSRKMESDKEAYLLNEAAVKAFGWADSLDMKMGAAQVIGVVKDFHQHSLHEKIKPVLFVLRDGSDNLSGTFRRVSVKIAGDELKSTVDAIEAKYNSFSPEYPFDYQYLDDIFDRAYQTEIKTSRLINWFAGLTILVACLGLYGLASYRVEQRIKEVGIRKVLGASVLKILALLSKDFLKLLVIAFLIAAPIAYYFMSEWLNNFAYRISIGLFSFVFTFAVMVTIAGLAVGYRSYKVAVSNPVNSLRME